MWEVNEEVNEEIVEEVNLVFDEMHLDEILFKLKVELAMRRDNNYMGTKMGGNPSQFYYFMTHDAIKKRSPNVNVSQEGNTVVFSLPPKAKLIDIRKAFDKFWETCPDKNEITQEQLSNPSFLKDLNSTSIEIKLLIMGLEVASDLIVWLDRESDFREQVNQFFSKEDRATEEGFLAEMKLPLDYFKQVDAKREQNRREGKSYRDDKDPMRGVLEKHPVWGKRWNDIAERQKIIIDKLFSNEDLDKLNKIGSLPLHIVLFVVRSVINLDRAVKHNLDEKIKFFEEINTKIKELFKE